MIWDGTGCYILGLHHVWYILGLHERVLCSGIVCGVVYSRVAWRGSIFWGCTEGVLCAQSQ